MAKFNHLQMENRISVCREYAELWQTFFQFLLGEYKNIDITEDMEREFENTITILALNQYKFQELCGDFMKDTDGIIRALAEVVSLQTIKEMQESTLGKITVETHALLIDMHKALGRMLAKLTPKQLAEMQARNPQPQGTSA